MSNEIAYYNAFKDQNLVLKVIHFDPDEKFSVQNIPMSWQKEMTMYEFLMENERYASYRLTIILSSNANVKEFYRFLSDADVSKLKIDRVQ